MWGGDHSSHCESCSIYCREHMTRPNGLYFKGPLFCHTEMSSLKTIILVMPPRNNVLDFPEKCARWLPHRRINPSFDSTVQRRNAAVYYLDVDTGGRAEKCNKISALRIGPLYFPFLPLAGTHLHLNNDAVTVVPGMYQAGEWAALNSLGYKDWRETQMQRCSLTKESDP